jgi:FixJ family two-component response regulator
MNVLLVEDNVGAAKAMELSLISQEGIRSVETVHTLTDALKRLQSEGISVILLDLGLPDADSGIGAMQALQAAAPKVPVVVITGSGEFELSSILAGAQDFIEKGNVGSAELVGRLRRAFERHIVRSQYDATKQVGKEIQESLERLKRILDQR